MALAQPGILPIDSLEFSVQKSDHVLIAIPIRYQSLAAQGRRMIRFHLVESIKGEPKAEVWLLAGGDTFQWLRAIREGQRFLIGYQEGARWEVAPNALSPAPDFAYQPRFLYRLDACEIPSSRVAWVSNPAEIVRIVKEQSKVAKTNDPGLVLPVGESREFVSVAKRATPYSVGRNGLGPVAYLRVPSDAPIEEFARNLARRKGPSQVEGTNLLGRFKNETNIQLLRRLLKDQTAVRGGTADFGFGVETTLYPIRRAAQWVLGNWGEEVSGVVTQTSRELKKLGSAHIWSSDNTSAQIASLARFRGLRNLYVDYRSLSPGEAEVIRRLPNLERLTLHNQAELDLILPLVSKLKRLSRLHVTFGKLTRAGVENLRNAKSLRYLSLVNEDLDASYLPELSNLTQLRELTLLSSRFGPAATRELRRLLPHVRILPKAAR